MKNIILKSALVLALGVAPGAGLAQTEMLKKKPAQQTEGQTQMPAETGTQEPGATTKSQTEGQAGTQMKKSQQTEGQAQAPAGQDTKSEQTQDKAQAPADQGTEQQGAASKEQTQEQTGTTTTEGTAKTKPAPDDDTAKTSSQPSNETTGSVNVTAEQKTEIKQVITETKAEPVRDVNFEVNIGVAVPRTIELQPLPPRIVKLVPRYEGYRYFLLADGRIVIVDPDSLEIVVIIA
ncbi:DUF1236 domain-containing protein [Phyllobacterium zundukense]|jgi:hypothetical protein|uniref:DUF1236 domain-containing protein n=2 Tax=Phyllobacterium zundukense TaxID=1867719 RepID=A0ACD4D083_9HYPH|nr:DUF1236 domain-containing protein [Phyllobacterium zundukense]UXN59103.1 DUF1236 domain-containing protein [Phyllobacterium zundukense]UXN60957.1 DUF1236 domain-containing protein [Phyllobacterium zundukense]